MRISYQWLAEYVDGLPPPEELARRLTAVGLEVEGLERRGAELAGVVAARIVASEKHPNAEKLSVTQVDRGEGEPLQIVCGAKNFQVGDVVPLATVGTVLPGGTKIEKAKLRGVESFGMLCSARELGLEADASGLFLLPRDLAPGTPIAKALQLDDVLLEVNVTPNRPDALSHLGIAREVAALLGRSVKLPAPRLTEGGGAASDAVRVRIEAPEKCARYAARVIEGVKIGPSPGWLARRLEACGVRAISNVVDATNFVLFDLDRVAGREIVVRTARPGEKLTTLDGKERALDPDDLVIADRERGSALAGVMGGGDSEIGPGTTRVLLESAWFAPQGIRRTARRHGLQSEAAYRFERGADPGMVLPALDRCAALIAELAGGSVRAGVVDVQAAQAATVEVRLCWARPGELLGMPVSGEDARLYELARAYRRGPGPGDEPADEWWEVAGVVMGRRSPVGWSVPAAPVDLYDVKAAVKGVLAALAVDDVTYASRAEPWSHPRASAAVLGEREAVLGTVGELHPRVAIAFGLPRGVFAFRLDLTALLAHAELVPRYRGVPRFPAVLRDLAVVVADGVEAAEVVEAVEAEPLVEGATLFDLYTGAPIPPGKKNLALALRYRAADRTLTDAEVDEAHARIVARLREDPAIRAELRG